VTTLFHVALWVSFVVTLPAGSRALEGVLQQNGVSEPVARYVRYAGYVLTAVLAVAYAVVGVRLLLD
jgi:hypothetical protein